MATSDRIKSTTVTYQQNIVIDEELSDEMAVLLLSLQSENSRFDGLGANTASKWDVYDYISYVSGLWCVWKDTIDESLMIKLLIQKTLGNNIATTVMNLFINKRITSLEQYYRYLVSKFGDLNKNELLLRDIKQWSFDESLDISDIVDDMRYKMYEYNMVLRYNRLDAAFIRRKLLSDDDIIDVILSGLPEYLLDQIPLNRIATLDELDNILNKIDQKQQYFDTFRSEQQQNAIIQGNFASIGTSCSVIREEFDFSDDSMISSYDYNLGYDIGVGLDISEENSNICDISIVHEKNNGKKETIVDSKSDTGGIVSISKNKNDLFLKNVPKNVSKKIKSRNDRLAQQQQPNCQPSKQSKHVKNNNKKQRLQQQPKHSKKSYKNSKKVKDNVCLQESWRKKNVVLDISTDINTVSVPSELNNIIINKEDNIIYNQVLQAKDELMDDQSNMVFSTKKEEIIIMDLLDGIVDPIKGSDSYLMVDGNKQIEKRFNKLVARMAMDTLENSFENKVNKKEINNVLADTSNISLKKKNVISLNNSNLKEVKIGNLENMECKCNHWNNDELDIDYEWDHKWFDPFDVSLDKKMIENDIKMDILDDNNTITMVDNSIYIEIDDKNKIKNNLIEDRLDNLERKLNYLMKKVGNLEEVNDRYNNVNDVSDNKLFEQNGNYGKIKIDNELLLNNSPKMDKNDAIMINNILNNDNGDLIIELNKIWNNNNNNNAIEKFSENKIEFIENNQIHKGFYDKNNWESELVSCISLDEHDKVIYKNSVDFDKIYNG